MLGERLAEHLGFELRVEPAELLSNLVFEIFRSCGGLIVCGFYSVVKLDVGDDFGKIIKTA